MTKAKEGARPRLSKADRRAQLLGVAREMIRVDGADALTLGALADRAGITKPVVYEHFGDRSGLFAALYRQFDERQDASLETALANAGPDVEGVVDVVAASYIACARAEGIEMAGVVAALHGTPVLARMRQESVVAYVERCRAALARVVGAENIDPIALEAAFASADVLAGAVLASRIDEDDAHETLVRILRASIRK
ncbi:MULTISPECIES: TetR/AcrR family transcriptional regulator [unclassified Microbacterium]|uniref:TetR/AcrR family transcriptional regulator n=1 Tax=unclassified Microbacterium TaxID=2609290 RepID=UPI00109C388E|nr:MULTISPECIES: TetR/AcrR family transcriptional regulator [unclassified Microbacterium]